MIKNFRISITSFLIHINGSIFFYPKLKKGLKNFSSNSTLSISINVNKSQTIRFFKKFKVKIFIFGFGPHQSFFPKSINNKTFKNCEFHNLEFLNN